MSWPATHPTSGSAKLRTILRIASRLYIVVASEKTRISPEEILTARFCATVLPNRPAAGAGLRPARRSL